MTNIPKPEGEKLLPCPFCGGKAKRIDIEDGENAGGSCIACSECNASGNVEFGFKENFVSNWNRRSTPAPDLVPQDVAELLSRIHATLLKMHKVRAAKPAGPLRKRDAAPVHYSEASIPRNGEASQKLTTVEAAAYLRIAASTLTKMRLTGGGPSYLKLGARRVVYDVTDLEAWAASGRRHSTSGDWL